MELINPSVEIITPINAVEIMKRIEAAGRTCYKSENKITEHSAPEFIKTIMTKNHVSVIEHEGFSVRFVVDRGVSHELVRHRLMSFSQESTRYVNYNKRGIQYILPPWVRLMPGNYDFNSFDDATTRTNGLTDITREWLLGIWYSEHTYKNLIKNGWKPEQARSVLPNSLKTEIVVTGNLRNWRHILSLRTSRAAHPQMREVMNMLYDQLQVLGMGIFINDITPFRE